MGLVVFWLIMAGVVAMIANSKGLNSGGWFVYGLVIWPIALVHVLVTSAHAKAEEQRALAGGDLRKCPHCAELIKKEAVKCRFCGEAV